MKDAVHQHWSNKLQEDARTMSSLSLMNIDACSTRHLHPVWRNLMCPLSIRKASVKALLLTKRYPLTTCPTSGQKRSDVCPLCKAEPETVPHFVLSCDALFKARLPYLKRILQTCRINCISIDPETLVKIILDSTFLPPEYLSDHEKVCRDFLFKLHSERAMLLGGNSEYKNFAIC